MTPMTVNLANLPQKLGIINLKGNMLKTSKISTHSMIYNIAVSISTLQVAGLFDLDFYGHLLPYIKLQMCETWFQNNFNFI